MASLFVKTPKATFDPDDPNEDSYVLIYGDEVQTSGAPGAGRIDAVYRNRPGKIDSARLSANHPCEVYFVDAGQGDATFIVTPGFRKILVDGGRGDEAFQFLVWKYRLDIATNPGVDIDLLVLSHTDEDHLAGLKDIVTHPRIHVRRVIHSGIAKYKSGFNTRLGERVDTAAGPLLVTRHDAVTELATPNLTAGMEAWRKAIADEQTQYGAVDSTTGQINLGDPAVTLTVLGPRLVQHNGAPAYPWFDGSDESGSHTVNGHSVVFRLDCGNVRMLFPGDVNIEGSEHLLGGTGFAAEAEAHVLKAPHHGSHEFKREFLDAVQPQITVISSGDDRDHGHPRPGFLGYIGMASRSIEPLVYSTELAGNFRVVSGPTAESATTPPPPRADPANASEIGRARAFFHRYLNGMINVRTDGNEIHAARRVVASYQFITEELAPIPPH